MDDKEESRGLWRARVSSEVLQEFHHENPDLGTYIPIVLALSLADGLDRGTTLIFTGVYNFVTGALYGVPMPVQPMKSIAAAAISGGPKEFGVPEIMAAGIITSGVVFFLGVTGLMRFVYRDLVRGGGSGDSSEETEVPLVGGRAVAGCRPSGSSVGEELRLGEHSGMLSDGSNLLGSLGYPARTGTLLRADRRQVREKRAGPRQGEVAGSEGLAGLVLAIVCACFIVIVNGAGDNLDSQDEDGGANGANLDGELGRADRKKSSTRRVLKMITSLPSAVMVFVLGVILAVIRKPSAVKGFKFGPSSIHAVHISRHAWKEGFVKGAVPQIPLSVLNSVVAVCRLAHDLFPEKAEAVSATSVSVTVGLMNLVGCWFGAMPCCHGAGGLAGQYKFGARSGGCVAALGMAKLVVGLVLGGSLRRLFVEFPVGLLGVLLLFAGIELAMTCRDLSTKEESFVVLLCTAVSLVGSSAALGFVCGLVAHLLLWLRKFVAKKHN
ncbi:hypothetical protein Taro_020021 [Colocasia esculenta]|uniref:Molybdate transporter 1 n=1 Tax=Colocasia esculenta TaxID=4460 RepID=A0A843UXS8_COLES|nr:hypothetical protein [Colocasia esculenta]